MGLVCSIHSQDKQITNIDHHYHRLLPACITGTVFDLICSIGFSCLWWMCVDHCIEKRIAIFVVNSGTVYEWSYIVFQNEELGTEQYCIMLWYVFLKACIWWYWIFNQCISKTTFNTKLYFRFLSICIENKFISACLKMLLRDSQSGRKFHYCLKCQSFDGYSSSDWIKII